ncbi:helix-turn-helix domain-containing protein [Flavivirga rizhaonensis]|uniref:AraC family transcriptional regulator n=1 Tax=Flavivirga rizhaonensis TaxID=2559571 RepID=A0A4V3P4B2_9FLAO|nr:AraC family transcriptional regulator [Flavivirga rizhaonensis]TGV00754.1 AraC family transcriptional regulator [Flavivirga rizhaonensis]
MKYKENKRQRGLSHVVKCFWEYDNLDNLKETEYTIIPDGYFDLICVIDNNNKLLNVFLTGIWTQPVNTQIKRKTKLFGIRFKLMAAEYIFKQSISAILNTQSDLPIDFLGIQNAQLHSLNAFAQEMTQKLNLGLKTLKEIDNRKLNLFKLIYKSQGDLTVKTISETILWSSRQINRYFNQQYGFSLKTYLNILKCHASYSGIANGELFPTKNYFDQPHFIKEIKRYTGATPKELYQNKNDRFLQLFTLGE